MEFCVLGLLMIRDMTIYEIHQAFKRTLSLFFSGSMGSIQFAVRKLLEGGRIDVANSREGGREKKIYTILQTGRESFASEIVAPVPLGKLETVSLARLSFLGVVDDRSVRVSAMERIVEAVEQSLANLESMDEEYAEVAVPPDHRGVFHYQMATLEYGLMSHRSSLEFFRDRLRRERGGEE